MSETLQQSTQTSRIRGQMTFAASTLQQELQLSRTVRPEISRLTLELTDSMLQLLPTEASYLSAPATSASPLRIAATRTASGTLRIEATAISAEDRLAASLHAQGTDSLGTRGSDTLTTATAAATERHRQRTRGHPPDAVVLTVAALLAAAAAGVVMRRMGD